ncbi:HAMP domain-containing protein [Marinomonas mediterranea]|uniref:ATP-binding protein n=1 Tax=Marinomonas mediterranea TaxID=119864 RepID=UPI00234A7A55|nr:ATP-binding protein [Marinomonas mediterranea]WCN13660.1 HAMP domain-containing protein [Marinomonas mediterranea]
MIKLFFRLSFFVFVPLLFLILSSSYSPIAAINHNFVHNRIVEAYKGTFYLIEQKLNVLPPSQWPEKFPEITADFAYHIELLPADGTVEDYQGDLSKLKPNEYVSVFVGEGDLNGIIKHLYDGQWYLYMELDSKEEQAVLEAVAGTHSLLMELLNSTPKEEWRSALKSIQPNFGYELDLITQQELSDLSDLSDAKKRQLQDIRVTWRDTEEDTTYLYMTAPDNESILVAGPILLPGSSLTALLFIILVIVSCVSFGILSFIYPLWRDLNKLAHSSAKFGEGHLTQRAKIGRFSSIRQVATTFNTMADQIEKMVKGQRDLTNAIAHDLRTPLSRLSFAFEMLRSENISEDEKKRYEKSITSGIHTLDNLINQILALSRYSRATDITHFGHHPLGQLILSEIDFQSDEHPSHVFQGNVSKELQDTEVFVDQKAMLRALNNLITNALRYGNSMVAVDFKLHDEHFYLSVEDDGLGIPEKDRQRVFLPFKQLDNEQRESAKGHGLGLAIVQQIADWHDGEAYIESSSLGGAKITIKWPIKR